MTEPFELPQRIAGQPLEALRDLASRQEGVARRDEIYATGVPRHLLRSMLGAKRWRALGQVIIVMHNGPLTATQEMWAAVRNAGSPAAIAARTAAGLYGLKGWDADCIEIIVPKGALIPSGLGLDVKVHESRRFGRDDIHGSRGLPQVRVERALIDAAVWSRGSRTACGVIAAGVQQRLTTASRLREELEGAGSVRHRRVLLAALTDIEGGAQAVSELDFIRFCRRNGLPRPALQQVRLDPSGRRRYLDATLLGPSGRTVHVEIDGALHLVVQTYWADMARGNDLVIGRASVLRFPSYVIHSNDRRAADQLRRALGLSVFPPSIAS